MSKVFPGITKLIKENSVSQLFSCNVGIPYRGKDRFNPPIPFTMDVYIVENPGDSSTRVPEGDTYSSKILLFGLNPISVFAPIPPLSEYVTFGFVDTNFTLVYNLRMYRIVSQKHVNDLYYAWTGDFSA